MRKRKIIMGLVIGITIICIKPIAATAKSYLLGWDLVDSGKHLDYDGNSKYMSNVKSGVSKWEAHKKGVIRPDSLSVIEDVFISDVSNADSINATTYKDGYIKMNKYNLDKQSGTQITRVATHEIGHALGLGHSTKSDIMYGYDIITSSLTKNDKDSYNEAYKKY